METEPRFIDFEVARKNVMNVLAGKVTTPVAVKVYAAMKEAAVECSQWVDIYGNKYANPRYACSSCGGKALWHNVQDELLSWHEVQALSAHCPHCGREMMNGGKDV